ncbi:MAG TPA: phosphatidylglycerol lysyltransferase domain-containing protein, partial [Acidimicrobiales bacterium]|nr:phosphatidylglycerol lysyltransferase domain-containing protein [Acidimicrobiales bacterium]
AWAVGLCGALDLVSAIIPRHHGFGRLESLAPSFVPLLSALAVPVGVVLLLSARVLARGNVWAYRLSVTLLSISTVLHLLRGLHFGAAVASGLVAVALVARRQDFRSPGNPSAPSQSFGRLAAMIAIVFAYGVTTLVINRIVADLPISLPSAALDTLRAMIGTSPRDSAYFIGRLGEWFPWSVISLMAIGVGWAAAPWLAPWRDRFTGDRARRERARQIITKFGTDTLSPFALRADKDRFFFGGPEAAGRPEGDEVLIAYRTVRGIALMSGDPIGPPDKIPAAIEAFLAYAHLRAWGVAVLGASDRYLDAYRAAGLRGLYHGDEAVIEVASFSLQGGAMKSVRQAAHRVERNGYVAEILPAGAVDPSLRQELRDVERQWLGGRPKTGFVMELEDLFALDDDDALFVIARSGDGRVVAFLHLAVCRAGKSLSLSSPPRRSDLPNGVIAWLVCKTVEYARNNGYGAISLNFSPFAGLFASGDDSIRQHLERDVLLLLKRRLSLQLDNLLLFNRKFNPVWRPRYVLFERYSELPRVIVSAMAAEGYLPFSERIRGRGWKPAEEPAGSRLEGGEVSPGQPAAGEDDEARVP